MDDRVDVYVSPAPQDDGHTPLALALGLAAAIAAGGLWAAIAIITNLEIGYAAWGVGVLVGLAMARATQRRSKQLALAAAAFALLGLIAGKAFTFVGSAGAIADELTEDPQVMRGAMAWQMYEERTLDEATLAEIDRTAETGDTLSDAAWESMLRQADARLAAMSEEERREAADATARSVMSAMGVVGGIRAQLSAFDLLWVFLAVGTAYQMMSPGKQAEPATVEHA